MYKSKVGYPRYYRKKLIEYNKVDDNFFKDRYYKDLDNMQLSIVSELKEAHICLNPEKNYFNITLSQLFNIEKLYKPVKTSFDVLNFLDNSSGLNKKIAGNFCLKGLTNIPITKFIPYTYEEVCDIIDNHWFVIYKKYIKMKHDLRLKGFILKNKDKVDPYE